MYEPILSQVRTKQDKELLISELELLKQSLFEKEQNFEHTLQNSVRSSISDCIKSDLSSSKINKEAYLNELLSELNKLQLLQLTIAFEPRKKTIDHVFDWVSTNLGPGIILELEQDPSIIGGATISFKGEYRDFSLRSSLEKYHKSNQKELINIIKT